MSFQPTMLGFTFWFGEECEAMITDETETDLWVESSFFTGWMSKAEFYEALGVEE